MNRWHDVESIFVAALPPHQAQQARATLRFAWGLAPWGIVFAAVFAALAQWLLCASLLTAAVGVAAAPLVLRQTGSLRIAAHWMNTFLAQSLLIPAWLLGGVFAACIPWLLVCIVSAVFLAGVRAGLIWAVLSALGVGALWAAESTGVLPEPTISAQAHAALAALTHSGLFLVSLGLVVAARDVTATAQAEIEAARAVADDANRAKSDFLARMSHELRTPMNAIIGYSELLLEDADSTEEVEDLQRIRSSGDHLLELINDVLDLSKVDAGQLAVNLVDVDAESVARDVLRAVDPLLRAGGNRATLSSSGPTWVRADRVRLKQCLLNLVSNSAKFTDNGDVEVRVAARAGRVLISVRDTGIGVPAGQLERIFEPFAQASSTTQAEYGGTGLGLSMVRQLVQAMGGQVWADSVPGEGSTFSFSLSVGAAKGFEANRLEHDR